MTDVFGWLRGWWNRRRRAIDIDLLWPSFVRQAKDLDQAKQGFFIHTQMDDAWSDLSHAETFDIIESLPSQRSHKG